MIEAVELKRYDAMGEYTETELRMYAIDLVEFAERWVRLRAPQKHMIKIGCYRGTVDELALYMGYNAPATNAFRRIMRSMESMGLLDVLPGDSPLPEGYDSADEVVRRTKVWKVPDDWYNRLYDVKFKKREHPAPFVATGLDRREYYSVKRRERYLRDKEAENV